MAETIDGNLSLDDQESAIQFKEAKGYRLKSLAMGARKPPTNKAEFEKLPIGEVPDLFKFAQEAPPDDGEEIWSGRIFVKGKPQDAAAYREPE